MSKKYSELFKAAMENVAAFPATLKKGLMYFNSTTNRPGLDDGTDVSQLMLEKHLPEARRATKVQLTEDANIEVEGTLSHTKGGTGINDLTGFGRKALTVKETEDGFEFGDAGGGAVFEANQVAHGLAALDVIYHNGSSWVKAQANAADTVAEYVVVEVFDVDNFKAAKFGKFEIQTGTPPATVFEATYSGANLDSDAPVITPTANAVTLDSGTALFPSGVNDNALLSYENPSYFGLGQTGAIHMDVQFRFNSIGGGSKKLLTIHSKALGLNQNRIEISYRWQGDFQISVRNSAASATLVSGAFGPAGFYPTLGQNYNIKIEWDFSGGIGVGYLKFYINDVLHFTATQTAAGSRTDIVDYIGIGSEGNNALTDGAFLRVDNVVAYSAPVVGLVTGHGLTVGEHYFLSQSTAGALDVNEPITGYSCPVLYAEDANNVHVEIYRANLIGDGIVSDSEIGNIIAHGGTSTPVGFLRCDGSEVSRVTYGDLFAVIGTNFGVGDGSSTFNLPDLRGQFLRGWSEDASVDPDGPREAGSTQADGVGPHAHRMSTEGNPNVPIGNGQDYAGGANPAYGGNTENYGSGIISETRPKNVAVRYYIRYAAKGAVEAESKVNPTVIIPDATTDIDWQAGEVFTESRAADKTFTFSNTQDGKTIIVSIENTDIADHTINFPLSVSWPNGAAITNVVAGTTTVFTFVDFAGTIRATAVESF